MNTTELEKCLHLISYWTTEDETVISELLRAEAAIIDNYIQPFQKELNNNMLSNNSFEAKGDLIKYYMFEFFELQGFYKQYQNILFTGSLSNYSDTRYKHKNTEGKIKELNEFENYVVNSWQLFNMLLNEIQLCCIKYKIDFFKVCNELCFSTNYLDCGITLGFEKMQKDNLLSQSNSNQEKKLKIDQIALKYAYEGLQITRENGNEIAKEYGHNSGEKLFQRFTFFSSSANRKGKPNLCTPKRLDNKIKLIESIIELLPTDKQERAKDEVSILKKIYEAEYQ